MEALTTYYKIVNALIGIDISHTQFICYQSHIMEALTTYYKIVNALIGIDISHTML
jgi:hypothetical protein